MNTSHHSPAIAGVAIIAATTATTILHFFISGSRALPKTVDHAAIEVEAIAPRFSANSAHFGANFRSQTWPAAGATTAHGIARLSDLR
ncbi:hypothetical protein ASD69_19160 [Lysobacter sp. Root604]|nr:hypothetical protein ASD69_19160 [Lysobacter sp. Root604]